MALVLTEIEKLDGQHKGLAATVKMSLQRGDSAQTVQTLVHVCFPGLQVTLSQVESFRMRRWVPELVGIKLKKEATQAAVETFGGTQGLDNLVAAQIYELLDEGKLSPTQLIATKSLFGRLVAQDQEFQRKTGQLQPDGEEVDPAVQSANVLKKIKAIFGLSDDEDEAPAIEVTAHPLIATSDEPESTGLAGSAALLRSPYESGLDEPGEEEEANSDLGMVEL